MPILFTIQSNYSYLYYFISLQHSCHIVIMFKETVFFADNVLIVIDNSNITSDAKFSIQIIIHYAHKCSVTIFCN